MLSKLTQFLCGTVGRVEFVKLESQANATNAMRRDVFE